MGILGRKVLSSKSSYTLGFNGKMVIHPKNEMQIKFSPSKKEFQAQKILNQITKASKKGHGAIAYSSRLLDIVTIKQAKNKGIIFKNYG